MIRAVLFDLGGTLHTSSNPPGRAQRFASRLMERLDDYGLRLDTDPETLAKLLHENSESYKHYSEQTLRELPPAEIWADWYLKGFGLTKEQLAPMAEELSFLYDYDRVKIMRRPHLKETMEELKSMGLRLGIISNIISTSVVPHFLAEYGILEDMEVMLMSSTTGIRKPSAGIFRVAEEQMGLTPQEFAYVGDTISRDIMGVRNAGWKCMIQIVNPSIAHRDKGLEGKFEPDYRITDLSEIADIIRKENHTENE